jgi:pimeloyl-ACP methyl ester carboxylesterase
MHLELVCHEPPACRRPVPVVFVHGAWHGAWCWAEQFLPCFARHGFAAYAFDLRGHGKSDGGNRLNRTRIADYVADLDQIVRGLDSTPVVVGHSMGGVIVQKYLETHRAAAGVLMASLPPSGGLPAATRWAGRHPLAMLRANATRSLRHLVATPELAREAFFSDGFPHERLMDYSSRLQDESYRAFLDMLLLDKPRPGRVRTPILVLGAERDTILTHAEIEATARAYATEPTFLPTAHSMMLDEGWELVADRILTWLESLGPTSRAPTP